MNKSDSLKDSNEELKKSVRLQESSQEIEDRHQDLLGHIKAVQFTHDLQGQLLSVNQEITEFLGYDKNFLLNMNIRNLLALEVRHEFDTYLTEIKRQGNAKGLMLVQTATGEKRILIYNNTLQAEGVATPTVQGIAYDITKYIQTERALRQVSGQLSIILESLPIVCYIGKAEGDYGATYITHNIKAITGFEDTNFTSKSSLWADRIHPEDAPRIFVNLPQIFEKGYHEHQYRWQVADGSYKWFYHHMRVIISSNGKKCIIGMMQDITERKRAEEALLNAAQQWRTTFDGISDFVSLLDLDGKILRCNKAMKDFVGKPFNEIINHSCWEIILGTTTPIEDCPFLRMKETLHRETTILSVNDLWFNVSVDPIFDQASRLIGAVNIISDISKRKQAEEAVTKLSQENATVAEIGRIISSTLNIEEVYERFAEEARKLISFDRISVSLINCEKNTASVAYGSGGYVQGREVGDEFPLTGSAAEWVMRTRSGLLIQTESEAEVARISGLLKIFQAGHRSIIVVPLISKDIVIGVLFLGSTRPNSYTDYDLKLVESIGNQIAGAIANAQLFNERRRVEDTLRRSEERYRNIIENIKEGYYEVDLAGNFTFLNNTISIQLGYSAEELIGMNYRQYTDEKTARELYQIYHTVYSTGELSKGLDIDFIRKDGTKRFFEIIASLIKDSEGKPIGFRGVSWDVTDRKEAEEVLRRNEEEAKRLSQENAVVAEIGRIISSTLNIEEVYERFAEEVRKLIPFDRIALTTITPDHRSGTIAYVIGVEVKDRNQGAVFPLTGSLYEEIFSKQSGILVQTEDESELAERYSILLSTFQAGLRSMISVPLISKGQVIGVLHIRSLKPNTYTELDLKLAERVGNQIAGAIANAQLFIERKHAEEAAKRLSQENAIVAEIGRIISSTLNIEEVYEGFAEKVRKLIPFERITINNINLKENTFIILYNVGMHVADREVGRPVPLANTATEWVMRNRSTLLVLEEDREEMLGRIPGLLPAFNAGVRSMMFIPLISKDQVIGTLALQTAKPNAYTEVDLKLAERVSNQIAGAIANAQLFIERKRAEGALLRSEEEATRLSQENAIMAEIGRIISSTLNIEEVYERFAEEARKLIPFDRITINLADLKNNAINTAYITGVDVPDQRPGNITPLTGTATEEIIRTRSNLLIQGDNIDEAASRFPRLLPTFQAGLRSLIFVPLISKDQVIGVLSFRSLVPKAYTDRDVRLAESIGTHIAGAIANAQLFAERKQAEEALLTEKQRFQTVSENAPFGMAMIDQTGTYKYINPKFKELFGYDLNDIPDGKTWFRKAFPDPAYQHQVISAWINDNRLESPKPGEKISRTFRVTCKDGTEKIIEFRPVKLETSEYLTSFVDITLRKNAEDALQRSEEAATRLSQENAIMAEIGRIISSTLNIEEVYERFAEEVRKLIPFDRIALTTITPDHRSGTMAYVLGVEVGDRNQGAVFPLTGSLYEEIFSKQSGILVQTEDESELAERYPILLSTFQAGLRSTLSVPLISKGQVIGVLHIRSLKPNAYTELDLKLAERVGNQIAGAIANAQLFIERKHAEEAAKRLSQENATVAEIGQIISSTLNIEEVYEGFAEKALKLIPFERISINIVNHEERTATIAYVNGLDIGDRRVGVAIPLAGTFTEAALRARSSLFIQAEDPQGIACSFPGLSSSFQVGFRSMMAVPLISKDEVIGVLHIQSLKPNAYTESEVRLAERVSNQIAGAIANAQLFNERLRAEEKMKALEDQLRQAQKMEAIGRLAGGVAHDFNNLLTAIKGYSQISLVMLKEGDPLKENIEEIQKAANRAANLTKQLLVFSRSQILELKVLHLNTILQDLDKMLHRIIGEDIELVYSLSNDLGQVKTDPTQMEQVILNLAINAKDAMSSGGKLTIETSNATLDESFTDSHIGVKPGDYVMLSVSDTGMGMTPEIKERIFEPFFTTKEKGKGTGLGLSIVYGIVKQSGGSIWVYSELGLGTTFKVFLPRIKEDAESLRPTAVPTKSLQGSETILVVEDEEIVRKLACKVLEKNGYRVLEASNGEEALHIVQKQNGNPIHLVVTDVVMPGMSGRQLIDRLVSLWPQTKALYMSGYTNDAIVHHGVLAPGIAYIQKPFTPNDLILKVRTVLDGP